MNNKLFLIIATICCIMISCNPQKKTPPYKLGESSVKNTLTVPYEDFNGVKVIPVKLNGVTMSMIYDTGASGIQLSWNEVQTLLKNGQLNETDILGVEYTKIADGSVMKNASINIRKIEIGGNDGIILHNMQASVALNLEAPILLGNSVLNKLASVEVDNVDKTIKFHKR